MQIIELRHGNIAHMEGDAMVARTCSVCKELKSIENYNKHKTGYLGFSTSCKSCHADKRRRTVKERYAYNKRWREKNKEKYREGSRAYYDKTQGTHAERKRRWRQANPEIDKVTQLRRLARKRGLEDDFTPEQMTQLLSKFGGCALTGSDDVHFDHVIPLAMGCVGTTYKNMIPLRGDLNLSKNARNLFEWFEDVKEREQLSNEKFNELIKHLADINSMTLEEYRKHVYTCHKEAVE